MTWGCRISWHAALATAAVTGLPATAWAHAFDDRYDLPLPLSYFVTGATAAVGLSFLVAAPFVRRAPPMYPEQARVVSLGPLLSWLRPACGLLSALLLVLTVLAGLFGTRDPVMNLAPTMVWIVWWVGLSLTAACIGNIWPALDPWSKLFEWADLLARRLGSKNGIVIGWKYPKAIGMWPAVALLLCFGWFEVVYPEAAEPNRIASAALAWSGVTLLGRICFGREKWERNADVFSVYFATLGKFAPTAPGPAPGIVAVRPPGRALMASAECAAVVGFVIAMLATVLFDGLLSGQFWWSLQASITRAIPLLADDRGHIIGAFGLVTVWLLFLAAYLLACWVSAMLLRDRPPKANVLAFALTLVPIAIGYNIAHNFSSLLVQGQQLIPLLSDPLGLKWDLFGTASYRANIGIIDARTTWYVAMGAIVTGHVVSIWLAHHVALREFGTPRKAMVASVPLTVLMLIYTAVSLSVIAEPMVEFGIQDQSSGLPQLFLCVGIESPRVPGTRVRNLLQSREAGNFRSALTDSPCGAAPRLPAQVNHALRDSEPSKACLTRSGIIGV